MVTTVMIGDRSVGPGYPCFVIAEAGVNHNGDLATALELVDVAAQTGADAVKFQTFQAELLATESAPKAEYQKQTTNKDQSQLQMLRQLELSATMYETIKVHCLAKDIMFISSPFDEKSADLLERMQVPAFKIPSGEITNLPFLSHVAQKGYPLIVSTGMANLSEVESAVHTIKQANNQKIVLLQCTSNYPANPVDVNLNAMVTMTTAFQVPVGYSDHTTGVEVSLAAAALGACVIEKHFTMDRNQLGPDHLASLEPNELGALIQGIRTVEASLGHGRKEPSASEAETAAVARKSLVTTQDVAAGQQLTEECIAIKRPGTGLPPAMISHILGRTTREAIPAGTIITLDLLA